METTALFTLTLFVFQLLSFPIYVSDYYLFSYLLFDRTLHIITFSSTLKTRTVFKDANQDSLKVNIFIFFSKTPMFFSCLAHLRVTSRSEAGMLNRIHGFVQRINIFFYIIFLNQSDSVLF